MAQDKFFQSLQVAVPLSLVRRLTEDFVDSCQSTHPRYTRVYFHLPDVDAVGTAEDPHAVALKVDNGLAELGLTVCADDEDLRQTLRCILQVLYAL